MATRAQLEKRAFDAIRRGLQYLKCTGPLFPLRLLLSRASEKFEIRYDPKSTEYIITATPSFKYKNQMRHVASTRLLEKQVVPTIIQKMDSIDKHLKYPFDSEVKYVRLEGFPYIQYDYFRAVSFLKVSSRIQRGLMTYLKNGTSTRANIDQEAFNTIRKGIKVLQLTAPPLLPLRLGIERNIEEFEIRYDPKTTEYIISSRTPNRAYRNQVIPVKNIRVLEKNVIPTIIQKMDETNKRILSNVRDLEYPIDVAHVFLHGTPPTVLYPDSNNQPNEARLRQKLRNYIKKRPAYLMLLSRKGMPQNIMREIMKRVNANNV